MIFALRRTIATWLVITSLLATCVGSAAANAAPPGEQTPPDFYADNGARTQPDGTIVDRLGRQLFLLPLPEILAGSHQPEGASHASGTAAQLDTLAAESDLDLGQLAVIADHLAVAFLDDRQFHAFASRTRTGDLLPDRVQRFSGIWSDATAGSTLLPWGVQAVAGGHTSTRTHALYIVDSGVRDHDSLMLAQTDRLSVMGLPPVMICAASPDYAHGTHVAGIAAGRGSPGGVRGVRPNARIVSVNVGVPSLCKPTTASVIAGLQRVREHIMQDDKQPKPAVVNLSINFNDREDPLNPDAAAEAGAIEQAMRQLAVPAGSYPGAFIAQSAGNQGVDACRHAYRPATGVGALPNDGIMVVAAIDRNGQQARSLPHPDHPSGANPFHRFHGQGTEMERGNNDGPCVDALAPGVDVVSTWSNNALARVSGTSLAAPHVAGLALHVLESGFASTPAAIERWFENGIRFLYGSNLFIPALEFEVFHSRPSIVVRSELAERNDSGPVGYLMAAAWHSSKAVHASLPTSIGTFSDSYLTLRYAADGADPVLPCTARIFRNGVLAAPGLLPQPTLYGNGHAGSWQVNASDWLAQDGNTIRFQVDCPSGAGSAWPDGQSSVTIELQPTPKPAWQAAAISTNGTQVTLARRASPTEPSFSGETDIHWTAASPWLAQGFAAPGAQSCQLRSYRIPFDNGWYGPTDVLYQPPVEGPFRPIAYHNPMPDQTTGLPGPATWIGRGYRWLLTCWNGSSGHHQQATSIRSVEMTGRRN